MAEFERLTTLKNVLWATFTKARNEYQPPCVPSISATSSVSRHDHHNVEIKTVSRLGTAPSLVKTDIYLFVPRNFEINSFGKIELLKDFRSKMRLALPAHGEQGASALTSALRSVRLHLDRLEACERDHHLYLNHPLCESVLESIKDLCAIIAETLKHGATQHTREFFLSHTLMTTESACFMGLETLARRSRSMHDMVELVRQGVSRHSTTVTSIISIFDEYISHLYVQYMQTIRRDYSRIGIPHSGIDISSYQKIRQELDCLLDTLQEKEARHRSRLNLHPPDQESELDKERRLVRLSHLKKFFQSRTFIEISRQQSAKRVSESTAAAGTALAGIVAALIERFSRPEVIDVAFQGLFVLSFGVIVYVLRDRMKDWAITQFQAKALKFLPDFQQQLMAKENKLGTVKEWFRVIRNYDAPLGIRNLRLEASDNEMEKHLPEDVIHCRKVQKVTLSRLSTGDQLSFSRSLHEYTRINLERYLKHMDDPFKELTDLDPQGRFLFSRSHRVYHFYLCVRTVSRSLLKPRFSLKVSSEQETEELKQVLVYRIVLDKNGIVRLEELKRASSDEGPHQ